MIKIGILGDIGSGKSYVAQNFGYPVFNADYEVAQLYKKNKNIFKLFYNHNVLWGISSTLSVGYLV